MYNNGFTRDVDILTRYTYAGGSTIYTGVHADNIIKKIENRFNGKEIPEKVKERLEKAQAALDQYYKSRKGGLKNLLNNLTLLAAEADLPLKNEI